ALKNEIGFAVIADNENNITLQPLAFGSQLPEVNSTEPIARDLEREAGLPCAFTNAVLPDGRLRLNLARECSEGEQVSRARATIISHAVEIESERRGRIRADMEADALASPDAGSRAVAFNPRAPIFRGGINARILQQPRARALTLVFCS